MPPPQATFGRSRTDFTPASTPIGPQRVGFRGGLLMFVSSKKSLLSFVFCSSLVLASTAYQQSAEQWRRLPGPDTEGIPINALFSNGDYLFAGGYDGVFRSTDQGQRWKRVN